MVRESFLAAMAEFAAEMARRPRRLHHDRVRDPDPRRNVGGTDEGFRVRTISAPERSRRRNGRKVGVPRTTWWWLGNDGYLGRIALRHRLTERLIREGGHIGYDVRPAARRSRATRPRCCAPCFLRLPRAGSPRRWSPATWTTPHPRR